MRIAVCGITPSSVHFRTYVEFLAARGHDVTVITNAWDFPGIEPGRIHVINFARHTRLIRLVPKGLRFIPRVFRLRSALREERFDVLDIMQVTPDGMYAALLWQGPCVLDFWGSDIMRLEIRPWWVQRLMPRAIRRADRIHSVSNEMTERLASMGAERDRIETFQYGIDLSLFGYARSDCERDVILSTRGLRPFYRTDLLVRALPMVLRQRPGAQLRLAGDGDDQAVRDLATASAELGVADRVHLLGVLSPAAVAEQLRCAAVWASIPPTDGTPLSLLEAMAVGAVPVVSDLATTRDWVSEARGVLVDEVTPEGVAVALLAGLEVAETGAYAAENRRIVEDRGDRRVNLARWERLLESAAQAARSR